VLFAFSSPSKKAEFNLNNSRLQFKKIGLEFKKQ
jgi:hypothetical protein